MSMSIHLKRAIEEYENPNSTLSEFEKYMLLGDGLYKNMMSKLIEIKNNGKVAKVSDDDEAIQIECRRIHKEMGQLLDRARKALKDTGKSEEDWKKQYNNYVQSHKPSMGSIVRSISDKTGTDG